MAKDDSEFQSTKEKKASQEFASTIEKNVLLQRMILTSHMVGDLASKRLGIIQSSLRRTIDISSQINFKLNMKNILLIYIFQV